MSARFESTLRSLERQGQLGFGLTPVFCLLGAWGAWMLGANVDEYTTSSRARLEVSTAVSRAAVTEGGRLIALHVALGRRVSAGDLLAELDDSLARAQLATERAELGTLDARSAALHAQMDSERTRRRLRARVDEMTRKRASLGVEQAVVAAHHDGEVARIAIGLEQQMLTSRVDALRADKNVRESQIAVDGASAELERLHAEQEYEDGSIVALLESLTQKLAELDAESLVRRTRIAAAEAEIERRRVRAPIGGRLGTVASLQIGDVVRSGDVIASIVPNDEVRVIAELAPEQALGRVAAGQTARVRLDGFSWLQYGSLEATVEHTALEPQGGSIRVELVLAHPKGSAVPVQHGLTGAVDIRTGRSAPWQLLARNIGAALVPAPRGATSAPPEELRP
jgi:multidrug resistance efflux pump